MGRPHVPVGSVARTAVWVRVPQHTPRPPTTSRYQTARCDQGRPPVKRGQKAHVPQLATGPSRMRAPALGNAGAPGRSGTAC